MAEETCPECGERDEWCVCFDDPDEGNACWECDGEGWIELDDDNIDDHVNMCDWRSGGNRGDIVDCPNCGGSGDAKDCTSW